MGEIREEDISRGISNIRPKRHSEPRIKLNDFIT